MKILIAGGAGFVGSNLAIYFKQSYPGYDISCIDNLSRKGSALNLPRLQQAGIRFRKADTRFAEQIACNDSIDIIIDAAAEPSVLAGVHDGLDYLVQTNFNGTVNLLNLARQHRAGFVFLSTSRVYPVAALKALAMHETETRFALSERQEMQGVGIQGIAEDFSLKGSRSLYGATKLASELMVEEFNSVFGLQTIINRCGVIAGPWQMGKVDQGFIALWLMHHYWQKPLQYLGYGGSGKQVRDVLHIHDLFRLVDYQVHHIASLNGSIFNAGGGLSGSVSLKELTQLCNTSFGLRTDVTASTEERPGDIPIYITDNSRVTAATGWRPEKSVEDVVNDTLAWVKENEPMLKTTLT